jgi:predicted GNAT family acetyltransferase
MSPVTGKKRVFARFQQTRIGNKLIRIYCTATAEVNRGTGTPVRPHA